MRMLRAAFNTLKGMEVRYSPTQELVNRLNEKRRAETHLTELCEFKVENNEVICVLCDVKVCFKFSLLIIYLSNNRLFLKIY